MSAQAMDARTNRARDRLEAAEAFVRDCLVRMGQHADADDPWLVRSAALRVLEAPRTLEAAEAAVKETP